MQEYEQIKIIADCYGYVRQREKLIEELAELIRALARRDPANMVEEIADVEIMIAQIKYLQKCETQVEEAKRFKIDRQLDRLRVIT